MNKQAKTRKRISVALSACLALTLAIGSMAYFTDRVQVGASATSGNVRIESTGFAGANAQNVLVDRDGKNNLNPGDVRDLTFTVSNEGNKAVDVRHTIKLAATDSTGAALALTEEAGQAEFDIYKAGDVTYTAKAGYVLKTDAKPVFSSDSVTNTLGASRTVEGNTITYHFADTTLLGKDGADNAERVENADLKADVDVDGFMDVNDSKDAVTYKYILVFRNTSLNKFMNSGIQVDMVVEAKQHYNTNDTWATVAVQECTAGNLTVNAVPNHAEDTVGGTSVTANNGIADHTAITGTATKNALG